MPPEYDGEAFHSQDRDTAHDQQRRERIRRERRWTIDAFRKEDVYGPGTDIGRRLRSGFLAAKKTVSSGALSTTAR